MALPKWFPEKQVMAEARSTSTSKAVAGNMVNKISPIIQTT